MAEYNVPEENRYSKDDEWIRSIGENRYRVGITDYAQEQLGDVVFVELPELGLRVSAGQAFGVIESVKAVADLYCPLSGEVVEINSELEETPERVNQDCYETGWLITLDVSDPTEFQSLMDANAYGLDVAKRSD